VEVRGEVEEVGDVEVVLHKDGVAGVVGGSL
jgi:hypothetical protein